MVVDIDGGLWVKLRRRSGGWWMLMIVVAGGRIVSGWLRTGCRIERFVFEFRCRVDEWMMLRIAQGCWMIVGDGSHRWLRETVLFRVLRVVVVSFRDEFAFRELVELQGCMLVEHSLKVCSSLLP